MYMFSLHSYAFSLTDICTQDPDAKHKDVTQDVRAAMKSDGITFAALITAAKDHKMGAEKLSEEKKQQKKNVRAWRHTLSPGPY